jgi:dihydrofolate synthase / folylpolyglutamate synthase
VQFGRELISKKHLAQLTEELIPIAESFSETEFGGITEFEFKTALGFLYWKRSHCEWVALEVGLGGRLDATNVVTPKTSVIVSIGLDHTNILGHSLEEIAYEKAGVIKPGVPVVVGEMPIAAFNVIERVAKDHGAELWRFGNEVTHKSGTVTTPVRIHQNIQAGVAGHMQDHNVALAVAALDAAGMKIQETALSDGAKNAYAPGRFERMEVDGSQFLMDGAHNPDAARVLVEGLREIADSGQTIILVTGMVAGHDPKDFYRELAPYVHSAHLVPINFHRALTTDEIANALTDLGIENRRHKTLRKGLDAAKAEAGSDGLILVTGSFYLVGEVGRALDVADRNL